MKGVKNFVVEATSTHIEKSGSIHLLKRFENQGKANQFHKVVAVPKKYADIVEVGDTLCVHFNILVFDRKHGNETPSPNYLKDNLYWIPEGLAHFVMKPDGEIKFLQDKCLVDGTIGKEEITTDGGIILPDVRPDNVKKREMMTGTIVAKSEAMWDVEIGDRVGLAKFSDYTLVFPDGTEKWLVDYSSVLFKYDE